MKSMKSQTCNIEIRSNSCDLRIQRFKDWNTFIHQNYTISTWIDTLTLLMNNFIHVPFL